MKPATWALLAVLAVLASGWASACDEECTTCDATQALAEVVAMAQHCVQSQWGRSLHAWAAGQGEGFWTELAEGDLDQFCLELMIALKTWPELAEEIAAATALGL